MNDLPPEWSHLRKNKRRIVELVLKEPHLLWSYPYFKTELCGADGMSERRLRSNLKSLVDEGILGMVTSANSGISYGLPHITNDPVVRNTATANATARGGVTVSLKVGLGRVTPEEMIDMLKRARDKPVIRPTGRSRKVKNAQLKNYMTGINWQIDYQKQMIAKRAMEKRRQEIEDKYSMTPRDTKSSRP
jgi:hypothetical protein